jgi:hypothetical protein
MDVKARPETALEIERIMAQVVKMEVGRPVQVAIVKGLKRKLGFMLAGCESYWEVLGGLRCCYCVGTPFLVFSGRGEVF